MLLIEREKKYEEEYCIVFTVDTISRLVFAIEKLAVLKKMSLNKTVFSLQDHLKYAGFKSPYWLRFQRANRKKSQLSLGQSSKLKSPISSDQLRPSPV